MASVKLAIVKGGEYLSEISGNEAVFTGVYCGYDFKLVYSFDTGTWKHEYHKMPPDLLHKLKWEMYSRDPWLPVEEPSKDL